MTRFVLAAALLVATFGAAAAEPRPKAPPASQPAAADPNLVGMTLEEAQAAIGAKKAASLVSATEGEEEYRLIGAGKTVGVSAKTRRAIVSTPIYTVTVKAGKITSFSVRRQVQ